MNTPENQRILLGGLISSIIILFFGYYITNHLIISTILNIAANYPAVRIYPGAILAPVVIIMAIMMLVIAPLKFFSLLPKFTSKMEKPFNWIVLFSGFVLVFILPFSTIIQNNLMPQLGYSKCQILEGNPTLWFTDWIKNPALCVKGKSLAWVAAQGV